MEKLIDPEELLRPFKYEIYCATCGETVLLTDYKFSNGAFPKPAYCYHPDGTKAKKNDPIPCGCEYELNPLFGGQKYLIRENKDYAESEKS